MSDAIQHECGIALLRLKKPLEFYKEKYGTAFYGVQKMYLLMEKQHNRGQDGAGLASIKIDVEPGERYISRIRSNDAQPIKDIFAQINDRITRELEEHPEYQNNVALQKQNIPYIGELFLGHVRYGTFGKNSIESVHPFLRQNNWKHRNLIVAGNFNMTNVKELFQNLIDLGQHPKQMADTVTVMEKIGHFLDDEVTELYKQCKLEGFSNSSRYFEIIEGNKIFINHEYKGVFKLIVDKDFTKIIESSKETSIKKGIHSSIFTFNKSLFYASKNGIYRYSSEKKSFQFDKSFSSLISKDKFLTGKIIPDVTSNKLWSFSTNEIRFLSPGKLSNKPELNIIPLKGSLHKSATGYENIINLTDKKYLIGTTDGFLIIDLNKIRETKDFSVTIDAVFKNTIDTEKKRVSLAGNIFFSNEENNLEFTFSVPNFSKTSTVEYQYQLEGLKENWTLISKTNTVLLENLPAGDYVFKVKAFIDNKPSLNVATYRFEINRPWYLLNTFIVIYIVLFVFIFYCIHVVTKRYYRKQRQKLLVDAQKELELKELENSQKIIKLNNDKLRLDIENKNRELATSTMSMIKKNEFLNTIKTELVSGGKNNLDKVVKIIDKNLNNTDDWKLFQEAFNNADKKFLKKIKNNHPELTPNDLRLCAYLRLNLSSKEIAPLLNISPRSVEVKRYRLRKKMNLEHDANLTNYILEL